MESSGFWKIFAGWSLTVSHLYPVMSRHHFICTRTPCTGWGCPPSVEFEKPSPRRSVWMKHWPQHSGQATAHTRTPFLSSDQPTLHAAPCSCLQTPSSCLSVTWNPKKKVLSYWRCPWRLFTKHPRCPWHWSWLRNIAVNQKTRSLSSQTRAEDRINKQRNKQNLKMLGCVKKEQGDMET